MSTNFCRICSQPAEKHCASYKQTYYCSSECQRQDWKLHKTRCSFLQTHLGTAEDVKINAVKIHSPQTRYSAVPLSKQDAIFNNIALPVTLKVGYPLVMAREYEGLPRGMETDNQHATWLNIDPKSGFAPPHWQGGIGHVIVARADGKDLDIGVLGAITDYISDILDAFGEAQPRITEFYNRARLDRYIAQHLEKQARFQASMRGATPY